MDIVLHGVITGLLLSILVGATFFMLIETSMTRGFRAALWFDSGVVFCDALLIVTVYFFAAWITKTIIHNEYFNIAGGLVFMGFGINYILSRKRNDTELSLRSRNVRLFLNGFVINLMNPSVILFWFGTMAFTLSKFTYNGKQVFIYYLATLLTMVTGDVLKAFFAYKLSHIINARILRLIYIFSGLLMIGLGFYFIFVK